MYKDLTEQIIPEQCCQMLVHVLWKSCQSNFSVPRLWHKVSSARAECGIWQRPACDGCARLGCRMPHLFVYPVLSGWLGAADQIVCSVCEHLLHFPLPTAHMQQQHHSFNGLLSKSMWLSLHQKDQPYWILLMPSVLWHCWLGVRKSIRPIKMWVMRCWRGYLLERSA